MIKDAKNTPLNLSSGTVPNVGGAMLDWFQQLTFIRVVKSVVNFEEVETKTSFSALGVVQPMGPEQLKLKADGQTSWKWYTIHADPSLILENDEIINYLGDDYRIMSKADYSLYGYVQYDAVKGVTP